MTVIKYGLWNIKENKLMEYDASYYSDEESSDTSYCLELNGEHEWLVNDPEIAEYVRTRKSDTYSRLYDTSYEYPCNTYNPKDMKVVKVTKEVSFEDVKNIKLPTFKEFCEWKRDFGNDPGYMHFLENEHYHQDYGISGLKDYLRENKGDNK